MKQVLQNLKTGETELVDVPVPQCRPGHLLISTRRSLISAGTERTLVDFSRANLLAKARSQPEKVQQAIDKVRTDGLLPTLETVFARLDQPLPLGYCNSGIVLAVGDEVADFNEGDRVASNGPHAEVVCVPKNLCSRIPDTVTDDDAAFTALAAVGLQGIRLAAPTIGESIVVFGLGLVGLMTVQLLLANGCRVLGIDLDPQRCELARRLGAYAVDPASGQDPVAAGTAFSSGRGVDAVLITASTKSSAPVHQAAQMSRKRGRIILIGVTGLELSRADFYEKELEFQISCSYGPGRYDGRYEQQGQDYPFGFVRWTAQRNFEAVLQLMAENRLDVKPLISRQFPHASAEKAYRLLTEHSSTLGILLTYPETQIEVNRTISVHRKEARNQKRKTAKGNLEHKPLGVKPVIGVIGAGNFATGVLLPALRKTKENLKTIISASGASGAIAARRFGFSQASSDYFSILKDPEINCVIIATRHNSHARLVVEALEAGKHVFVEKPLALTREELSSVKESFLKTRDQQLFVGFNRRFSSLAMKMKELVKGRSQPITLIYTVNAGQIPPDHWTQNPAVGGGRIIGEGCHFIDFLRFLTNSAILSVTARMIGGSAGEVVRQDKMTITIEFADGSIGTVHYFANGSKRFPKERVEVFSEGRVLVLDNFRRLRGYGWPRFRKERLWRQDKGHAAEVAAFVDRVKNGGDMLIPWHELEEVTLASFAAVEQAEKFRPQSEL